MNQTRKSLFSIAAVFFLLACSFPAFRGAPAEQPAPTDTPAPSETPTVFVPTPTETPVPSPTPEPPTLTPTKIPHALIPATNIKTGKLVVHDAVSSGTAFEQRAPYGDLYDYNWFERPFLADMTYVPDLDIASYNLNYDEKFFYISIETVGSNPNNPIGIYYAVELDQNGDGYGDYIIIARPEFSTEWTTDNMQVIQDTNRDTGGLSAERSDAPLPGDGYDTVVFDLMAGIGNDFDLAWSRILAGPKATVQIAFKRYFFGERFFYGVVADGNLKSAEDMDYVDRFTEEQAGSPERGEKFYPLKSVFAIDNVCREAYGISNTSGEEPQRCKPRK